MPEVIIIESVGNGRTKEIQEMDFEILPGQGEFLTLSMGSATAVFVIEAVIHKVALGRKNRIVLRVRNVGGEHSTSQPPPRPQLQHQQQPRALPPGPIEASPDMIFDPDDPLY